MASNTALTTRRMTAPIEYHLASDSNREVRLLAINPSGTVILASWPYTYFVIVPVNIWLCAIPPKRSTARELMRDWGLLEWGQTAIGLGACCVFAWALALPVPISADSG